MFLPIFSKFNYTKPASIVDPQNKRVEEGERWKWKTLINLTEKLEQEFFVTLRKNIADSKLDRESFLNYEMQYHKLKSTFLLLQLENQTAESEQNEEHIVLTTNLARIEDLFIVRDAYGELCDLINETTQIAKEGDYCLLSKHLEQIEILLATLDLNIMDTEEAEIPIENFPLYDLAHTTLLAKYALLCKSFSKEFNKHVAMEDCPQYYTTSQTIDISGFSIVTPERTNHYHGSNVCFYQHALDAFVIPFQDGNDARTVTCYNPRLSLDVSTCSNFLVINNPDPSQDDKKYFTFSDIINIAIPTQNNNKTTKELN